ncbi:preprotein translocase subunit YajC [Actinomyces sp. B33]|uniref:preprotein translocase subunit YajC n=1 Tax=Actinomyces sp. B33 TaxID=2942131 RepID=UPI0023425705|nr:preprotein translocase subunit YajC [Actinomyces sp. B33]MDC4233226.1 preprotein translocase subunit YajC [Actinomyces sp. B33]
MAEVFQQYSLYIIMGIVLIGMMWFSSRSRKQMQAQQAERERSMAENMVPGAWVHTAVGFWGRFVDADGDVIVLETADGVEMYWDRSMIREVGTEPPFAADPQDEEEADDAPAVLGLDEPADPQESDSAEQR